MASLSEVLRGWLLADVVSAVTSLRQTVEVKMEQINQSLAQLAQEEGQVGQLAQGMQSLSDETHTAFMTVEQELADLKAQVNSAADPAAISSAIDASSVKIQAAIDDARQSMGRIAADATAAVPQPSAPTP